MSESPRIRRYIAGEKSSLFDIYFTVIHLVASHDYTPEQVQAWAPRDFDVDLWARKMREINPFVAELNGELVAYADVQSNGYIDHFFVSGKRSRRGIGSLLMKKIIAEAASLGIPLLTSNVSRTAQPFFQRFGFVAAEERNPEIRGIVVPNALMCRKM
jgi:putative acetyltransferase